MDYKTARDIVETYLNDVPKKELVETFLQNISQNRTKEIARLILKK